MTFLAHESGGQAPRIVSDVTGWGEHIDGTFDFAVGRMRPIGSTDLGTRWQPSPSRPHRVLIAYGMADYRLDPHNPRPGLTQPEASEFVMPGYVPPQEFVDPPVLPAGLVAETLVESQVLGGPCRLTVYTPPGYRREGRYALAVFADQPTGPVPRVLDWLIARRAIEPIVSVFVETGVRGESHDPGAPLGAFLADELLTWLAPRYGVTPSADRRAVIGISFSAKDALEAAHAPGTRSGVSAS